MAQEEIVAALMAKRDALASEVDRLRGDIAALDRTIAVMSGGSAVAAGRRRAPGLTTGMFDRNELKNFVLKSFRQSDGELTVQAIAAAVAHAKGIVLDNPKLRKVIETRVRTHVSAMKDRGILANGGSDAGGRLTYSLVR
jgi:hypothetical protein